MEEVGWLEDVGGVDEVGVPEAVEVGLSEEVGLPDEVGVPDETPEDVVGVGDGRTEEGVPDEGGRVEEVGEPDESGELDDKLGSEEEREEGGTTYELDVGVGATDVGELLLDESDSVWVMYCV